MLILLQKISLQVFSFFICVVIIYILIVIYYKYGRKYFYHQCIFIVCFTIYIAQYTQIFSIGVQYSIKDTLVEVINVKTSEKNYSYTIKDTHFFTKYYILYDALEHQELSIGSKIELTCALEPVQGNKNMGLFNYQEYAYSKKIFHTCFQPSYTVAEHKVSLIRKIKQRIQKRIATYPEEVQPYLSTYVLAESSAFGEQRQDLFIVGVSHLFIFSPKYLFLLQKIWSKLLSKLAITREMTQISFVSCILVYLLVLMPTTSYSITRAITQVSIRILFPFFRKQHFGKRERVMLFAIIQLYFILVNPFIIYQVGFQITIYCFFIQTFVIHDCMGERRSKGQKLLQLAIPLLILFPFQLLQHQQVNILFTLIQVLYQLLTPFLYIIVLLTICVRQLTPLLMSIVQIHELLLQVVLQINTIWHITWLFAWQSWVLVILCVRMLIKCREQRNFLRKLRICMEVLGFILITDTYNTTLQSVHFLQLPDGEMIVAQQHGLTYAIDVGGSGKDVQNQYMVETIVLPFLEHLNIKSIDHLIITHEDADHMANLAFLLEAFPISFIYVHADIDVTHYLEIIANTKTNTKIVPVSTIIELPSLTILPSLFLGTTASTNNHSLVILGKFNMRNWLFMGDLEKEGERLFLQRYLLNERVHYLKVGHHGSKTSTTQQFLRKINPQYAIIVVQTNNRFNHPHTDVVERLDTAQIPYANTNEVGSIDYYTFAGIVHWKYLHKF